MNLLDTYKYRPAWRLQKVLSPAGFGSLTAAALAFYPSLVRLRPGLSLPGLTSLMERPRGNVYAAVLGFVCGYGLMRGLEWGRIRLIKSLLTYQGWFYSPRAIKTKLWAITLQLLEGSGSHSTLEFQNILPKQPLPNLDDTLDLWLRVTRQWLSADEYDMTKEAVEEFRKNEGKKLQEYLQGKAEKAVNWVSDYWLQAAYLSSRQPLPCSSNYSVLINWTEDSGYTTDQLKKAAMCIRAALEFDEMVVKKRLPPVMMNDIVPICMHDFKYTFRSTRIPGEHMDSIVQYPQSTHIVVIIAGHYFKMETRGKNNNGKSRILSTGEVLRQLKRICNATKDLPVAQHHVTALTSQKRGTWAKERMELLKTNKEALDAIESALFLVSLETEDLKDLSACNKRALVGNGRNLWHDKGCTMLIGTNAVVGYHVDHTVQDAMVFTTMTTYSMLSEERISALDYKEEALPEPTRINWKLEGWEETIDTAYKAFQETISSLDVHAMTAKRGKGPMKKCKLSPDGFVQMAMHLAFYRRHKEVAKSYEPSTGRLFALGRTETIHPESDASSAWVRIMDDPGVEESKKRGLLQEAITYQAKYRVGATMGEGCDRHLLALYCASRELGMDVPKIFMDKAWGLPFRLSTSQTPTRLTEKSLTAVDFTWCNGGFGPSCEDGYGICYVFFGDDILNFNISSWKTCKETDSRLFGQDIQQALEDIHSLAGPKK